MSATAAAPATSKIDDIKGVLPGLALSSALAGVAIWLEPVLNQMVKRAGSKAPVPAVVIALVLGMALHTLGRRPAFAPGITFSVKKLLRVAIALLGVRIALGDIVAFGPLVAVLVPIAMAATFLTSMGLARALGLPAGYGALAGAANAVCGASATLACATVVPAYPEKERDTAFTVVAANGFSTLAMVAYPPIALWLGFEGKRAGILFGATIHDMAQVVGAGYAVSDVAGNTAVVVKLFRVFLLLPVVLFVGRYFAARGDRAGEARVPMPVFALVFVALATVNSLVAFSPALIAKAAFTKTMLGEASRVGLLIAVAALGLGTSVAALAKIGWRHIVVFVGATLVLFTVVAVAVGIT